jgi:uncharacterized lipoprotein YmbA
MSTTRSLLPPVLGMLALGCLGACGSSPPMRYYTLEAQSAATAADSSVIAIPLRVERVTIPAELDRQGLVLHIAPGQVRIAELDSWAAPLDEMIRSTLSADLASRLGSAAVVDPLEPATREPRRLLFIDVASLYADQSCAITLRASWTLESPNAPDRRASEALDGTAVAACPGGMAQGVSRVLAELSDHIAAALKAP